MAHRIEIGLKRGVRDARGQGVAARARTFLHVPLRSCCTRDVYKLDLSLALGELRRVRAAFTDPVVARSAIVRLAPPVFDWLVEVGFKPGVTDNVGRTARAILEDVLERALRDHEQVYTGTQYFLRGAALSRDDATRIASELLANNLIQTIRVYASDEWSAAAIDDAAPAVHDASTPTTRTYDLRGADEDLLRISREGILSLSIEEMRAIRDHFARPDVRAARANAGLPADPTDVELECIAQTWSEHCKHKIFAARIRYVDENGREEEIDSLFKSCIKKATEEIATRTNMLVSVFSDNAGVIRFNDRYHVLYKVETHNTPSALDPYGGAMTGVVGVNRDAMGTGLGGELLYNTWGYCLGDPFFDGELPEGLLHPRRIRDGVHHGVIDGGNQSGIPWARGFERFDNRFIGKPLVFCGTVGRLPHDVNGILSETKRVLPGDVMVMAGGRIGKDGIHGATFSSEELRADSPAQAVQIGDPITQRKLYEFLIEARNLGLYRAITDNGAGGLSSSVGEMARLSGGADIDVAKAPLKYAGLQPWEIFLSEAQERMTLAVPADRLDALLALARRRDVEASALGTFTASGSLVVRYADRIVGRLDMNFLHEGCPRMTLTARWTPPSVPCPKPMRKGLRTRVLLELLGALNICSKEHKSRMYDAEVKGLSVVKPFVGVRSDVPSDATVLRVDYRSNDGVILAEGINPFYSDIDSYWMMASVFDEAVRRVISVGGTLEHLAGLDNFCWPDPVASESNADGEYKLAQLVRANKALYDVTTAYGVPCISGKDSMKNDSLRGGRRISIPPTVLFSAIGRIADVRRAVTMPFKQPGDPIYVVGLTRSELGASEFHRWLAAREGNQSRVGGDVPIVNAPLALSLYRAMEQATRANLLRSSHTPTLGGLAVAFALAAMGGDMGAEIELSSVPHEGRLSEDDLLFAESNSRFVVTCAPDRVADVEKCFVGLPFARVGKVANDGRLRVLAQENRAVVDTTIEKIRSSFTRTLHGL